MSSVLFCRIADGQGFSLHPEFIGVAAAIAAAGVALFPAALAARNDRTLRRIATACAIFQVGHFAEHGGQIIGLAGPGGLTLTWWARQIVLGYAWVTGREPSFGLEAMHFFGDLIYLSGVIAWCRLNAGSRRLAKGALIVQAAHQVEHLYLLTSTLVVGHPVGITALGPVPARIVTHFVLNFGGSALWAASAVARRTAL